MIDIIKEFERIRDIPYKMPLEDGKINKCHTDKVNKLKKILEDAGYKVRYRVCTFKWNELPLPKPLKYMKHDKISEHVFLEMFVDDERIDVDPTRDNGLTPTFEINQRDGKTSTLIGVPLLELYSPEISLEIMEEANIDTNLIDRNYDFYLVLNKWLEELRNK